MGESIWWRDCSYHPPKHLVEVMFYYKEQDTFFFGYYNHTKRQWFANGIKIPLVKSPDCWARKPDTPPEMLSDELPF